MNRILPLIVIAQFFCTSLWFAGNAVILNIQENLDLGNQFLAHMTSAIQFGFIIGTLVYAILTISDRFSPSGVFFVSSILAALFNMGVCLDGISELEIFTYRFLTGFFLAGIYPVGMKIASDYYQQGLGKSLGYLVGALVLGTAFPHLLKNFMINYPWKYVLYGTSILSILGGLLILAFVPDGPYRKPGQKIIPTAFFDGFKELNFRSAAFGYFGHMWELFTFWAFVPLIIAYFNEQNPAQHINPSLFSFLIIGIGSIACVIAGYLSEIWGNKKVATYALLLSGLCCIISPLLLFTSSSILFLFFLCFWGMVVIADSPLFSTLIALNAPEKSRGTALTIVNCLGFALTIFSIQFTQFLSTKIPFQYIFLFLAIGPIMGLLWFKNLKNSSI